MRQRLVAARVVAGEMEARRDMAATEASHSTLLNLAGSSWCDGRSRCDRLERLRWYNGWNLPVLVAERLRVRLTVAM